MGGAFSTVKASELGAAAIKAAIERAGIPKDAVEEVYMGCVVQAGMGQAPARQATLFSGLSESVEATTINKVCASGMKSISLAAQSIMLGHRSVMVAGGMESMSNIPFYLMRNDVKFGGMKMLDGVVHDGLWDVYNKIHMGNCGENTNKKLQITREEQDAYAIGSYEKTTAAWESGIMAKEVVPFEVKTKKGSTMVFEDEEFRKVNLDKLRSLRPAFDKEGTITAANSSKLNDGGGAVVLMSAQAAAKHGAKPMARVLGFADAATHPIDFPVAPALALPRALEMAGVTKDDITMFEVNEAFSCVVLANIKLCDLDPSKVNIHGGAVSLGHPIGMSGARLMIHLAHNLKPGEKGAAGICNGGGAATAMVLEGL